MAVETEGSLKNNSNSNSTIYSLMSFKSVWFSSAEHKIFFFKNVGNQTILVTIDFHCVDKTHSDISQNMFFYVPQK